jgi:hypothetical protein
MPPWLDDVLDDSEGLEPELPEHMGSLQVRAGVIRRPPRAAQAPTALAVAVQRLAPTEGRNDATTPVACHDDPITRQED